MPEAIEQSKINSPDRFTKPPDSVPGRKARSSRSYKRKQG